MTHGSISVSYSVSCTSVYEYKSSYIVIDIIFCCNHWWLNLSQPCKCKKVVAKKKNSIVKSKLAAEACAGMLLI